MPDHIKKLIANLSLAEILWKDHEILDQWVAASDENMLAYEKEWERLHPFTPASQSDTEANDQFQ